jgi:hypothetical protein
MLKAGEVYENPVMGEGAVIRLGSKVLDEILANRHNIAGGKRSKLRPTHVVERSAI